jgi:hypothetical protein
MHFSDYLTLTFRQDLTTELMIESKGIYQSTYSIFANQSSRQQVPPIPAVRVPPPALLATARLDRRWQTLLYLARPWIRRKDTRTKGGDQHVL